MLPCSTHSGKPFPWDNIWDSRYYKKTRVKLVVTKYKLVGDELEKLQEIAKICNNPKRYIGGSIKESPRAHAVIEAIMNVILEGEEYNEI